MISWLKLFPTLRGSESDEDKEDGGEVGCHQLALDLPFQMYVYNYPSIWAGCLDVVKCPVSDGVNWDPFSFFSHFQAVRNKSHRGLFKIVHAHFDRANLAI